LSEGAQETKLIFCNTCKVFTNHLLRARYARPLLNFDNGYVSDNYERRASIWSCAGCDEVTVERQVLEQGEEECGEYLPTRQQEYSPRKIFRNLNPELNQLYGEVVACFNDDRLVLCTMGLRAMVEQVCRDKGLTEGKLEHRIDGLSKFLSSPNVIEALHAFRVVGNDAVHELGALTRDDARAAIEVMEDLLNFLYDLDYRASQMKSASRKVSSKSDKPRPVN
jgi:hypothetical protein